MSGGARKESGAGKKFQTYNINDTYKGGRPETRAGANGKCAGVCPCVCAPCAAVQFANVHVL